MSGKINFGMLRRKDRQHSGIRRDKLMTCAERGHAGAGKTLDGNVFRCTRCGEACGFARTPVRQENS